MIKDEPYSVDLDHESMYLKIFHTMNLDSPFAHVTRFLALDDGERDGSGQLQARLHHSKIKKLFTHSIQRLYPFVNRSFWIQISRLSATIGLDKTSPMHWTPAKLGA
jgi:hypothetical protein